MTSYIVTFSRILMLAIKMCSRNLSFIIKGKNKSFSSIHIVKLRQGSGKDWQGMVTKRHLMAPNGLKGLSTLAPFHRHHHPQVYFLHC